MGEGNDPIMRELRAFGLGYPDRHASGGWISGPAKCDLVPRTQPALG
jgi:hypothetical protein